MHIENIHLVEKRGGQRGDYISDSAEKGIKADE
jgi:hypothetical protein